MVRTRSKLEYNVNDEGNEKSIASSREETQISLKPSESDSNGNVLAKESLGCDNFSTGHDKTPAENLSDKVLKDQQPVNNISETKIKKHRFYFPPPKSLVPDNTQHTSIDVGMEISDSYIDVKGCITGKVKINKLYEATTSSGDSQLKDSVITPDFESKHSIPVEKSYRQARKERKAERESTAGMQWYNFKPPEMTEEIKRDLKILQMRSVLDPKRFYKQNDRRTLPRYFQIGKIKDDATDFYSSRMPKKQRKATLTEELLADAEFRKYQKRKYNEIQMKQKELGSWKRFKKNKKFSSKKRSNVS